MDHKALTEQLAAIARPAGRAIMDVYNKPPDTQFKSDGSPVTEADRAAEAIILAGLADCAPDIPVVSEESEESHGLRAPERFFLVDPLDGTKEFLRRDGKGSFTVNIALVENGTPVLGVVFAPALDRLFSGTVGSGATETVAGNLRPIAVRQEPDSGPVAVASRSHRDEQTDRWLQERGISQTVSIGSSLKFCLVACGEADVYPRFGPTMEWDTAAGHAVLLAAGGRVTTPRGRALFLRQGAIPQRTVHRPGAGRALGQVLGLPAGAADAAKLDRCGLHRESVRLRQSRQFRFQLVAGKFRHVAAPGTDGKHHGGAGIAVRMLAGDKGVEAFQPVDETQFQQLVEGAVDLQRRADAVVAQAIQDGIGAQRAIRIGQRPVDQPLVFCQRRLRVGV